MPQDTAVYYDDNAADD